VAYKLNMLCVEVQKDNKDFKYWRYYLYLLGIKISRLLVTFLVLATRNDIRSKIPITTIFSHGAIGVVIAKGVEIGKDCIIGQNVTIGARDGGVPIIGTGVIICPHAIIIGNIKIGNYSVIGAGAVVLKDVKSHSVVVGNPAKAIRTNITPLQYRQYRYGRI